MPEGLRPSTNQNPLLRHMVPRYYYAGWGKKEERESHKKWAQRGRRRRRQLGSTLSSVFVPTTKKNATYRGVSGLLHVRRCFQSGVPWGSRGREDVKAITPRLLVHSKLLQISDKNLRSRFDNLVSPEEGGGRTMRSLLSGACIYFRGGRETHTERECICCQHLRID